MHLVIRRKDYGKKICWLKFAWNRLLKQFVYALCLTVLEWTSSLTASFSAQISIRIRLVQNEQRNKQTGEKKCFTSNYFVMSLPLHT